MGNKSNKKIYLPIDLNNKAVELFKLLDKDGSNSIEKKEAKEYWKKNFSQVNTIALFDQVDVNGDGQIELNEWLQYWTDVFKSGKYTEEYLINEVNFFIFLIIFLIKSCNQLLMVILGLISIMQKQEKEK